MFALLLALSLSNVSSNVSASAYTGGNVVSSGGTVTQGSSYDSVQSTTVINGGTGTSTVNVETDTNGNVQRQSVTKAIPPGGTSIIVVASSTGAEGAAVTIDGATMYPVGSSASTTASTTVTASTSLPHTHQSFMSAISLFFHSFFSFFARL